MFIRGGKIIFATIWRPEWRFNFQNFIAHLRDIAIHISKDDMVIVDIINHVFWAINIIFSESFPPIKDLNFQNLVEQLYDTQIHITRE